EILEEREVSHVDPGLPDEVTWKCSLRRDCLGHCWKNNAVPVEVLRTFTVRLCGAQEQPARGFGITATHTLAEIDVRYADSNVIRRTRDKLRDAGQLPTVGDPPDERVAAGQIRNSPVIVDDCNVSPIKRERTIVCTA